MNTPLVPASMTVTPPTGYAGGGPFIPPVVAHVAEILHRLAGRQPEQHELVRLLGPVGDEEGVRARRDRPSRARRRSRRAASCRWRPGARPRRRPPLTSNGCIMPFMTCGIAVGARDEADHRVVARREQRDARSPPVPGPMPFGPPTKWSHGGGGPSCFIAASRSATVLPCVEPDDLRLVERLAGVHQAEAHRARGDGRRHVELEIGGGDGDGTGGGRHGRGGDGRPGGRDGRRRRRAGCDRSGRRRRRRRDTTARGAVAGGDIVPLCVKEPRGSQRRGKWGPEPRCASGGQALKIPAGPRAAPDPSAGARSAGAWTKCPPPRRSCPADTPSPARTGAPGRRGTAGWPAGR